jgi:hypothetical protein
MILHLGERLPRLAEGGLYPGEVVRLLRFVYIFVVWSMDFAVP